MHDQAGVGIAGQVVRHNLAKGPWKKPRIMPRNGVVDFLFSGRDASRLVALVVTLSVHGSAWWVVEEARKPCCS
jgi:hypothetical protein